MTKLAKTVSFKNSIDNLKESRQGSSVKMQKNNNLGNSIGKK